MQMVIMPMSSSPAPSSRLPPCPLAGVLNRLDPLTYAVEPMRRAIFAHLSISGAAKRALDPGVTWWGWHVPTALEAAVIAALGLVMLFIAIWDSRARMSAWAATPVGDRAPRSPGGGIGQAHRLDELGGVALEAPFDQRLQDPRRAIVAPTQRGDHTREARRSMPRSIASMAVDSGAGLRRKAGIWRFISSTDAGVGGAHEVGVDEAE